MSLRFLLAPLTLLYRAGLGLDRFLRSLTSKRLPLPVISIGNLTMGGTGKTPLLIFLAGLLEKKSLRPAILTRGYRGLGKGSASALIQGPSPDSYRLSDESQEMALALPSVPIAVGKNRFLAATNLLHKKEVDVFLLDDGFQHWPLKRDLDLVVIDCQNPFGGGLFPMGLAREPRKALKRAHFIFLNRGNLVSSKKLESISVKIKKIAPQARILIPEATFWLETPGSTDKKSLKHLSDKRVIAVSAIGSPTAFEKELAKYGALIGTKRFPDHFEINQAEWDRIEAEARERQARIALTRKDWVKVSRLRYDPDLVIILRMELALSSKDQLILVKEIESALQGKSN